MNSLLRIVSGPTSGDEVASENPFAVIKGTASKRLPILPARPTSSSTSTQDPKRTRLVPTWSILTGILALVVGIAVGMYHWQRDRSGLQRWYFASYVRSALSASYRFRNTGLTQYQVIDLVDDQHPERTLTTVTDEDAAVTANSDGTLRLKYTEKWAQRKHLRALIRTISLDNEVMHGWLQEKVYGFQGIDDLVKWPLGSGALAAVTLFLAGLLFAIPADRRHAEQRRKAFTADCRTQRQP
jgi:hypothetical protein